MSHKLSRSKRAVIVVIEIYQFAILGFICAYLYFRPFDVRKSTVIGLPGTLLAITTFRTLAMAFKARRAGKSFIDYAYGHDYTKEEQAREIKPQILPNNGFGLFVAWIPVGIILLLLIGLLGLLLSGAPKAHGPEHIGYYGILAIVISSIIFVGFKLYQKSVEAKRQGISFTLALKNAFDRMEMRRVENTKRALLASRVTWKTYVGDLLVPLLPLIALSMGWTKVGPPRGHEVIEGVAWFAVLIGPLPILRTYVYDRENK
ncbi:MAG: hypothetical protein JNL01_09225 [Bdellovibrionales bacterium]|nr:hypothetical protein [Bdellovibrionales bacterium]